jgi:signal transduction histidine kinase
MTETTAHRLAWLLWLMGVVAYLAVVPLRAVTGAGFGWQDLTQGFAFFAIGTVGLVVSRRRWANPLGWIYLAVWACSACGFGFAGEYGRWATVTHPGAPLGTFAVWLGNWIWVPMFGTLLTFPFLLFPDGHLPSRRWRPVVWAAAAITVLWSVAFALEGQDYTDALNRPAANPYALSSLTSLFDAARLVLGFAFIVLVGLSVASLVVRFRRGSRDEREQIKWLMFAGGVTMVFLSLPLEHGSGGPADVILGLVLALIPIATGVAILKYHLYDIEVVISRTVVFGVLAAFITAVYVAIVIGVGTTIGSRGNAVLSGIAAAVVALAFQPVRRWAQRLANRLVYGERATPYEVLSAFSERLANADSVDDVLPRMARLVAEGTGSALVRVWIRVGREFRAVAASPQMGAGDASVADAQDLPDEVFQVRHQGEPLGAITVAVTPNEPMTAEQRRLTADVASQAGLVLRNVTLVEDLRASRVRLVAAQDEERRKLERNIHDGAQQQLVSLAVKQRLAASLVGRDDERVRSMLQQLHEETTSALEDLRDLARGIYPPLLADKGLAAALEAQARKSPVPVTVEPDGIGRYPQDAEAAVYFSCLEALQNVAKYANATSATVRLAAGSGELRFEVLDDGCGFDPEATGLGTGLQGMADRLAALGGEVGIRSAPGTGTMVTGRIPAEAAG